MKANMRIELGFIKRLKKYSFKAQKKTSLKLYWIKQDIIFIIGNLFRFHRNNRLMESDYAIGITTFMDRYKTYFKPLLWRLAALFPEKQIIIAVNGHIKTEKHKKYLIHITAHVRKYSNVLLLKNIEPKGLSSLWNDIIKKSVSRRILLLNDDLKIAPSFRNDLEKSSIFAYEIAVINKSWGHFLISKKIVKEIGWFDEKLREIGGEDDDYCARLAMKGINPKQITVKSIANISKKMKKNSYGRDMTGEHRYSAYNTSYLLDEKWVAGMESFEGAIFVPDRHLKYWKLRTDSNESHSPSLTDKQDVEKD